MSRTSISSTPRLPHIPHVPAELIPLLDSAIPRVRTRLSPRELHKTRVLLGRMAAEEEAPGGDVYNRLLLVMALEYARSEMLPAPTVERKSRRRNRGPSELDRTALAPLVPALWRLDHATFALSFQIQRLLLDGKLTDFERVELLRHLLDRGFRERTGAIHWALADLADAFQKVSREPEPTAKAWLRRQLDGLSDPGADGGAS